MNIDRVLGLAGLFLGVIPYAGLLIRWLATQRPARRFLGLHKDHPIEVIVSTNATRPAAPGEAKSHTTAVGELRAVAVGARTVLRLYKRKKVSVYMSAEYPGRLQGDVLLLGGPLRNNYSDRLLELVNRRYPAARLVLDARSRLIGLCGQEQVFDQRLQSGIPREDLALLVIASSPWSTDGRQRVVLCAGLTTYGTEGAARFLFQKVLGTSRESVRLRRLLSGPAAAALIHVTVESGRAVRAELHDDVYWAVGSPQIVGLSPVPALPAD
jgi:hypothetical protein